MQGVLCERFQRRKFPVENNQPASRIGHSTGDMLAHRYQHSRPVVLSRPTPCQVELLLIAGVHAYCEKVLQKSCFSVQFHLLFAGNFRFWKYFPLEHGEKCQILFFERNSIGASAEHQCSLTADTTHGGYRFPFYMRTVRFTTGEESLKGRCFTGMKQTCSTPFLSSYESTPGLPTVEVQTGLKSPPDQSTIKVTLIFLWGQSSDLCLQIAARELLSLSFLSWKVWIAR